LGKSGWYGPRRKTAQLGKNMGRRGSRSAARTAATTTTATRNDKDSKN
jgi:hypothetical protein